jgi:ribosome-associated protein
VTDQSTSPVPAPQDHDQPGRRAGLPAREGPARVRRRPAVSAEVGSADAGAHATAALEPDPEALELARRIVDLAADKKASDIVLLDVRALTTVTDYFVLCSGGSERQLAAIGDGVVEGLKQAAVLPLGREGGPSAHWVLLDYGFAVVHVMAQPERDYYALEKLWSDAPLLLRVL